MSSVLTASQEVALTTLLRWYNGNKPYAVLHGAAGFGKSFLINKFLKQLGSRVTPLLLADTNEATNVLKEITGGKYICSTVCSALGLALGYNKAKQVLIRRTTPDLSTYNLLIVDEASTIDESKLELLCETGKYILFVGHSSQLPPVDTELKTNDLCVSPVFAQGFPTFNLTEPVRNTGDIFTFCQEVERLIYHRGIAPHKFKVSKTFLSDYLSRNKNNFLENKAVYLAYSNKKVDELNRILRSAIFGNLADEGRFFPEDKLIFRSPVAMFKHPIVSKSKSVKIVLKTPNEIATTNTRAKVLKVGYKDVLGITCYELFVETSERKGYVYTALDISEQDAFRNKLYYAALYDHNPSTADAKWKNYHDLTYVLGNIKHSYALTVHNSQGSTIDDVFVDDNDIAKCSNPVLRKKLRYVAYSRAKHNLYRS